MSLVTAVLLTARFLLELALLAAWAVIGWNLVEPTALQVTLAVVLPIASATLWGLCLSPKARFDLALPLRVAIELVLFSVAALGLWLLDYRAAAVLLLGLEVVVLVALLRLGHPPGSSPEVASLS